MKIYKFVRTGKVGDHQSSIRTELKFFNYPYYETESLVTWDQ